MMRNILSAPLSDGKNCMDKRIIVFGGWGVSVAVLQPLFGNDAYYIDSNLLFQSLFINGTLSDKWPSLLKKYCAPYIEGSNYMLAGWSTGAMLAYGLASIFSPDALFLLSATPSFCRTASFKYGIRPALLTAMKKRLQIKPVTVLEDFQKRCGFKTNNFDTPHPWALPALTAGLSFLEEAVLDGFSTPQCPIRFFHGSDDYIVPFAAGEYFSKRCNASFTPIAGPHAFFTKSTTVHTIFHKLFVKGQSHESF